MRILPTIPQALICNGDVYVTSLCVGESKEAVG